jgi:two-component system CheB/CheR fusion protein
VDDLLDVTRVARGKVHLQRERFDLGNLVHRTVEDHRPGFDARGVHLACEIDPDPCWVEADGSRIVQVIGNLLGNALKFTNAGDRVHVVLGRERDRAALRVRDTGVGIAAELIGRLFEPFSQAPQTLDRSRGGLGLGLATVKGLVELHGGTVEVASEGPGRGARFVVRLPLAAPPGGAESGASAAPVRPQRVLVIEDNEDSAETLKDVLELSGHEVRLALDGPGGLLIARAYRPTVVICDIGLPGMSGYDVARVLRSEEDLRGAWLIALSGYASTEDARRAEQSGFDRHVAKPATPEKLAMLLAEAPIKQGDVQMG